MEKRFRRTANVSIHVPARGTTRGSLLSQKRVRSFQSTFPHGERLSSRYELCFGRVVSIHVPARGTTLHRRYRQYRKAVSIHVPARGTTICAGYLWARGHVSIHVPARGTTKQSWWNFLSMCSFNPRSRTGNDRSGSM